MRKHFLKSFIFIVISFLFIPMFVKANEGDLRYEITEVNISGSSITFKGWAFIHRTNNFNTIEVNGQTILSGGDQKILMRAIDSKGNEIKTIVSDGDKEKNYNFYCELFQTGGGKECSKDTYIDDVINLCQNKNAGGETYSASDGVASQCYYEDIYFEISFNISDLGYGDVKFQIAVSNANFEDKISRFPSYYKKNINYWEYDGDNYTKLESVFVPSTVVSKKYPDNIEIRNNAFTDTVDFIASYGWLQELDRTKSSYDLLYDYNTDYGSKYVYGAWNDNGIIKNTCGNRYNVDININGTGRIDNKDECRSNYGTFLGYDCMGTDLFIIEIAEPIFEPQRGLVDEYNAVACPSKDNKYASVVVPASFVKVAGDNLFGIYIKPINKCEVTNPASGPLECNESKTFNSKCDKLTVVTSEGNAEVTIEQTGHISSILTPLETYAGGGINFGIMYYNTIKWNYADGGQPSNLLHAKVKDIMNDKLKDYNLYTDNINITELKFNNKLANINMIKKCSTNKNSKDYYGNELVTTCVFSFPLADIALNGNVTYKSDVTKFNVNNKYYTPLDYNGKYSITAKISGMDRIKENIAKEDSKVKGTPWTGNWNDTFTNCYINLYTRIVGDNKFIYRPIDINNPFPNRNAGVNWYTWWSSDKNKETLRDTYSDLDYTVTLGNKAIADIKKYNESHNYLDWDSIDENTRESSFIKENSNYIVKVGDD